MNRLDKGDRMALKLLALMVAGLAVTYVPGDNYLALRFVGFVAFYGAWFWFLRGDYRRARTWLRTHKMREAVPRALEMGSPTAGWDEHFAAIRHIVSSDPVAA